MKYRVKPKYPCSIFLAFKYNEINYEIDCIYLYDLLNVNIMQNFRKILHPVTH